MSNVYAQAAYVEAVERHLEGLEAVSPGPSPGCEDCLPCEDPEEPGEDWWDLANEASFSHAPCDACGTGMAGSRYPGHGLLNDEVVHLSLCTDCVMFIANGVLPETWER
jgi:hypothetical protein